MACAGVRAAALYTPGTLNAKSPILQARLARPTLILHAVDAEEMALVDGDPVSVAVNGREYAALTAVNSRCPARFGSAARRALFSGDHGITNQ